MAEDYKVHMYGSKPKPQSIDVTVRASSAEDAKRQAQAQHPDKTIFGAPIRQPDKTEK